MNKYIFILLSLPKTIYINFKLLSLKNALKLPIFCHFNTKISIKSTKINLENHKLFNIKFGYGGSNHIVGRKNIIILKNSEIFVREDTNFSEGISLRVENASIKFGSNFNCNKNCTIFSKNQIEFGDNVLIGCNVSIMDNDGHTIIDSLENMPIKVSNNTWISSDVLVLKGSFIPENSVVTARAVVNKKFPENDHGTLIGGIPSRVLKRDITWLV